MDKYEDSLRYAQQAIDHFENLGMIWGIALANRSASRITFRLGDTAAAYQHVYRSLTLEVQYRLRRFAMQSLLQVAELYEASGQIERAVELFALVQASQAELPIEFWEMKALTDHLARFSAGPEAEQYAAALARGRGLEPDATFQAVRAELGRRIEASGGQSPASADSLTARELEILQLIADGNSNRDIARQLVLSLGTVKWYSSEIYSKLAVKNRTQAVAQARELGLLS
jgi:ATP/maltotriose-dependent transcriptional regulator MalT